MRRRDLAELVQQMYAALDTPQQVMELDIRCHERIATAIAMQDPAWVEAAMTEHFDSHVGVLLRVGIT